MRTIFYPDAVTMVRKKRDKYVREDINTSSVLSGSSCDAEEHRKKVIARLRKDPTVLLALEPQDGGCVEIIHAGNGITLLVNIREEDGSIFGELTVSVIGKTAMKTGYTLDPEERDDEFLGKLTDDVMQILSDVDEEDYLYMDPEYIRTSGYFTNEMEEDSDMTICDAKSLLEQEGFETESIHGFGFLPAPILFVHENEVILLMTWHFDGCSSFVEMKRMFIHSRSEVVESVVHSMMMAFSVKVVHLEDGSWSFRKQMNTDIGKTDFMQNIMSDISELKAVIEKVEETEGFGRDPFDIMREQRHLFIHEVIDAAVRFQNLPM